MLLQCVGSHAAGKNPKKDRVHVKHPVREEKRANERKEKPSGGVLRSGYAPRRSFFFGR